MTYLKHRLALAGASAGTSLFFALSPVLAQNISITRPDRGITRLSTFFSSAIRVAIVLAAILTFAYLIWGGIQWITSGGDKSAYEAARGRITAALIGLAIVAAAWALMSLVGYFFGINPFDLNIPSASENPPGLTF